VRARFRIEAEAVARLQHPNIVQIHEVGEADGLPCCALEFVEGGNLARKIAGQPLLVRVATRLVEALPRAMRLATSNRRQQKRGRVWFSRACRYGQEEPDPFFSSSTHLRATAAEAGQMSPPSLKLSFGSLASLVSV
jgi:hypothetical protein